MNFNYEWAALFRIPSCCRSRATTIVIIGATMQIGVNPICPAAVKHDSAVRSTPLFFPLIKTVRLESANSCRIHILCKQQVFLSTINSRWNKSTNAATQLSNSLQGKFSFNQQATTTQRKACFKTIYTQCTCHRRRGKLPHKSYRGINSSQILLHLPCAKCYWTFLRIERLKASPKV